MDGQLLDSMCDRLKPVLYTEKSFIVWEGDPVDEMFFIMRGTLLITTTNGGKAGFVSSEYRKAGDFCGEEIITNWALNPHSSSNNLPISTKTVQALTEVEAFALKADDLKFLATQFELGGKQLRDTCRRHSPDQWRNWAASIIQAAWRRYKSHRKDRENGLQDALAKAGGGSSLSLGATIYASRFAANALRTRKARVFERIPPTHVASETSRARF
ncbi:hypothetical protein SLA2020_266270 [Shorea laevis]